MGRMAKADLLAGIRTKLNSMSFQHTGDRDMDIIMAGNEVIHEARVEYHSGMFHSAVETLTAPHPSVSKIAGIPMQIETLTVEKRENGEILISTETRKYTVSTHKTKQERTVKMPLWSKSELDLRMYCQSIELHRCLNGAVIEVIPAKPTYYVNGPADLKPGRSLELLALIAKYRAINEAEAEAREARQRAIRAEMRRETVQQKPAIHATKPSMASVGVGRMVRPKWFQKAPPVLARAMGGLR